MIFGGNPALRRIQKRATVGEIGNRATYGGIALKSIYFILLTMAAAIGAFIGTIMLMEAQNFDLVIKLLIGSIILTVVCTVIVMLCPRSTKIFGSIYAICQGFMMGFIALIFYSLGFSGVIFAALFGTVVTFATMLTLYSTGTIRVGSGFKKFMISAFISMLIINLFMFIMSLFSPQLSDIFYGNAALSILISILMVLLASFMILLDLERMTAMVMAGLDKKYEWIASFGLLVTLIWLYMEFLNLFLKFAARRR